MPRPVTLLVLSNPAASHLRLLEELPEETHIAAGGTVEAFRGSAAEADVVFCGFANNLLLRQLWPELKRVRWIHSYSAGVERLLFPELVASPVPLTNGRGIFARPLAEFALASMLHFAKGLRGLVRSQEKGEWRQIVVEELHGRTLGVIGYGEIGRATARLAKAFGMRVAALRRRPELSAADPYADEVLPLSGLAALLEQSDYLAVCAALTPETKGMLGAPELARLKPGAVIVNVARGAIVDEAALIRALEEKRIRGAALDVYETEPLPPGHPFYRLDNVLLSPHCADHTDGWLEISMRLFLDNFQRFVKGEPLLNVVDKNHGY